MSSLSLLLDVVLSAALLGLADIVLLLVLGLPNAVPSQTGEGISSGTGGAIGYARGEVGYLSLGLLLLALEVLLTSGLLEVLCVTR